MAAPDLALQGVDTQGFTMLPKPAPVPNPVPIPAPTPVPTTTPTPLPAPAPSGSGLIVTVSEDAYQGDAQFVVTVDGSRVGGVYTATASHAAGQSQAITVESVLTNGAHQVGISFINDAYGGPGLDRNLFITGVSYNGQAIAGAAASLFSNGIHTFGVKGGARLASTAVIYVSEDAYAGDARYTVSVDGTQYGGVRTATASHAVGQSQAITIAGIPENFTKHDIAVSFLNDAHGASPTANRNLYVNTIMFDNQPVQDSAAALFNNGTHHFIAAAPSGYTGA